MQKNSGLTIKKIMKSKNQKMNLILYRKAVFEDSCCIIFSKQSRRRCK